jgi:hypothetical protein
VQGSEKEAYRFCSEFPEQQRGERAEKCADSFFIRSMMAWRAPAEEGRGRPVSPVISRETKNGTAKTSSRVSGEGTKYVSVPNLTCFFGLISSFPTRERISGRRIFQEWGDIFMILYLVRHRFIIKCLHSPCSGEETRRSTQSERSVRVHVRFSFFNKEILL